MIADLKPYPAYKDSGVPDLEAVPSHWEVSTLGRVGRLLKGFGGSKEDEVSAGMPCVRYGDLYSTHSFRITRARAFVSAERAGAYAPIRFGDVLFAASGETLEEIGKSAVNLIDSEARAGGDVIILRPATPVDAGFLGYACDAAPSIAQKSRIGKGVTVMHIYPHALRQVRIPGPPVDEQSKIARFLDRCCLRIQGAIAAMKRLIELLEEEKQAIIHRAVTRGLDPNVRLKPSGVDWLGDVPEHWEVRRLKGAIRLHRGYDLPADSRRPGNVPVVSSGGFVGIHDDARAEGPGVVMGRYGSTESVFFVTQDFWPHNTALYVSHFLGNCPQWVYRLLQGLPKADLSAKSAVPGLDRKDLHEIRVAVPPVEDQRRLVDQISSELTSLDRGETWARRQIDLLNEFRTRLIADVVTGKLDVRGAAAKLSDDSAALDQPIKIAAE